MSAALLNTASPFALSSAQVDQYRKDGFLGPFKAFEPSAMKSFQATIERSVLNTPTNYCPFGLRIRHLDSRTVFELCSAPAIVQKMVSIFGPDLVLWNSNLFNKPPATVSRPEEYPWHQDYYNWQMEPVISLSAWLAITPATQENGCVEIIPGSHRQIIPPIRETDERFSMRFGGVASDPSYVDASKKKALEMKPGEFFLFNERLLHHSNPNRTQENRLGLAIRVTVPIAKVSEPFPCLMLSGEDRMGFNRYVAPPTQEPDADWLAKLPHGHDFRFDLAIPGMGWHLLEKDGQRPFAWTGLDAKSWIDFRPLAGGDHLLQLEVAHVLKPKVLESAKVYVNDYPIPVVKRQADGAVLLEGVVSREALASRHDRIRVSLQVSEMLRPCDINSKSNDKRTLGLGISRISFTPR